MYFVLILLLVVAILFGTGRVRPDFVALAALCISMEESYRVISWSTVILLAGTFLLTALLSSFISHTATVVILAPIIIQLAESYGISPYPLTMTLAIAASAAYLTPVASPVNKLVVSAGAYRFIDFLRIGAPLLVITLLISVLLIPALFPF
jgi:di/tricarboxylate transporter